MSLAIKRAMMKHLAKGGKVKRDPDVKGVHQTSYEDPGQSMAGMYARAAKEGVPGAGKMAKEEHKQILSEIKNMKKPKLYAKGGPACADCAKGVCMAHGGDVGMYAEGGSAHDKSEDRQRYKDTGTYEKGVNMPRGGKGYGESEAGGHYREGDKSTAKTIMKNAASQRKKIGKPKIPMADGGIVDRIMYSRGGQVANETEMSADFHDNQFDDLVLRDDLHSSYTGENSGDELGSHQEDMDRHDIIARIMKSRAKKDRMPRPA